MSVITTIGLDLAKHVGPIDERIPLNGTDGPSEMSEPIDLAPPDPGCLARSKPWRPVHQRPKNRRG